MTLNQLLGDEGSGSRGFKPKPLADRFWKQVYKAAPNGCWHWTGAKCGSGYGTIKVGKKRRQMLSHRLAWLLTHHSLPDERLVLHGCDNRICVNPEHLSLGTHLDNSIDCQSKGRRAKTTWATGESNGRAKLSTTDVVAIRQSAASHVFLAVQFKITPTAIMNIRKRKLWRHVA